MHGLDNEGEIRSIPERVLAGLIKGRGLEPFDEVFVRIGEGLFMTGYVMAENANSPTVFAV